MLFQGSCCDPTGRVFRIGLDERIEQHTRAFNVANLCLGLDDLTI